MAALLATPLAAQGAAPAGTAQHATLLDSYKTRAPWKVAGVDYAVGINPGMVLKDPTTCECLPDGAVMDEDTHVIRVTGSQVTLDGFDFSLHGSYGLSITGGAGQVIIRDSYFFSRVTSFPAS